MGLKVWLQIQIHGVNYPVGSVSGCGSVGREVASNTRDLRFECCHWQILSTIICIETLSNRQKLKRTGMADLNKQFPSPIYGMWGNGHCSTCGACLLIWVAKIETSHVLQSNKNKTYRGHCDRLSVSIVKIYRYLFVINMGLITTMQL